MKKILMTFTNVSWQKGSAAQVFTFVRELRKLDSDIQFQLLTYCYDLDSQPAANLEIDLTNLRLDPRDSSTKRFLRIFFLQLKIILWSVLGKLGIHINTLVNNPIAKAYLEADLVADLSGDSYRDRPGGVSLAHNINVIAARLLHKPIVLVSQSLGPFKWYSREFSRRALNLADLIYIREKRTLSILRDLKIQSKITLAPDIAFILTIYGKEKLMEIYEKEGISPEDSNKTMLGISTSILMYSLSKKDHKYDYLDSMAELIQYIHTTYDAVILLIPHEIRPEWMGLDDRFISYKVAKQLQYPSWLKIIKNDYDPSEIKTLISSLDAIIAARMHAGIAALSSNVPALLLAWSHKYAGMLEEIGISECVWDPNSESLDELKRHFDKMMQHKKPIQHALTRYNLLAEQSIKLQLHDMLRILNAKKLSGNPAASNAFPVN